MKIIRVSVFFIFFALIYSHFSHFWSISKQALCLLFLETGLYLGWMISTEKLDYTNCIWISLRGKWMCLWDEKDYIKSSCNTHDTQMILCVCSQVMDSTPGSIAVHSILCDLTSLSFIIMSASDISVCWNLCCVVTWAQCSGALK